MNWIPRIGFLLLIFPGIAFSQGIRLPPDSGRIYDPSQIDALLALPRELQIKGLWDKYFTNWTLDSATQVTIYQQLRDELIRRGEPELAKQAWLLEVDYRTLSLNRQKESAIREITAAIEDAKENGWEDIESELLILRGRMHYEQQQFGPAFENMLRGYEKLRSLGFEKYPFALRRLELISEAYYQFGDYESAIRFAHESLNRSSPWKDDGFKRRAMNTLGLSFQRLHQYDSAMHYLKTTYENSLAAGDTLWAALALGNLGYVHYLTKDYDNAIPMLEVDFTTCDRLGETASAVNAALALSEIYLLLGDAEAAEKYIVYASKNVPRWDVRALSQFYKNRYTISKLRGDYQNAVAYVDSFHFFRDSVLEVNDARILEQAKLRVGVEQHASELKSLEARRDREKLLRNGALIFLLMAAIISGLWLSRINLKRKKEAELSLLQKKIAEDELASAQRQLHGFAKMLREKNELIESFQAEVQALHQQGIQQSDARTEHLNRLINATLLTEEDWREFRQLFDKVYPGFLIRLKDKMPDLNPAEIRLLALTKLQLAPKEMAAMLGIGYEAIRKSRQRLRKKINLPEEGTLDELVELI